MLLDKTTGANAIVQDKYVTVSVCKKNIEEQFHQDQWFGQEEKETDICHYRIYFGNLQKHLPK